MSKHTPGSWYVVRHYGGDGFEVCGRTPDGQAELATVHEQCEYVDILPAEANARLMVAAPELLHALKWATEYVCLFTGDGAGVTGVQQGHDRGRFRDEETGEICPENLRSFLLEVIEKAKGGE